METSSAGYWGSLLTRSRLVLFATALVALGLLPGLARLETDNSPDVFFVEQSADYASYQSFLEIFGPDQTLRLVLEGPALWSDQGLRFLAQLEEQVASLPGVVRVSGLAEHHRRFGWPPPDPQAFREDVLANGLDRAVGWVGDGGRAVTCLVQTQKLSKRERAALLRSLEQVLDGRPRGIETQVLGLAVLNVELDRSSREIEQRYFPLLIGLTILLLAIVIRSFRQLLAPLLFVALCQLLTLGPMGYLGYSLNMVMAVLPPIIFVISLATAVHLVLRVRHVAESMARSGTASGIDAGAESDTDSGDGNGGAERWRTAVVRVFQDKGWAIFWTGVTTATGFASLTVSDVAPVCRLGAWAAVGLGFSTLAAFTVLPALIAVLGGDGPARRPSAALFERTVAGWGAAWARFAVRHRAGVVAVLLLFSVAAAFGVPRLRIESNALRYLAADHPLRAGIENAERQAIGVAAVELLITATASGGGAPAPFVSALEVDRLADLASDLDKLDGVFGVLNAGIVLRDALRHVPQTPTNAHLRPQMALDGLAQDAQGREVLDSLLSEDRQTARSTVFVSVSGAQELVRLEEQMLAQSSIRFPEAEASVSGEYRLLLLAQRSLISTLVLSLALTLVAVAVVLRCLLPSFRLSLLALLPNFWPVLGGLGVMGWLGVPLDIATVMMASVVLGLAVDDTIHTLAHFRRWAPLEGARRAVEHTLHATAPAYVLTGVILIAGFGVCGLSDFAPIQRFGQLSAFSIGLAVLGDLLVLPALLSYTPDTVCKRLG